MNAFGKQREGTLLSHNSPGDIPRVAIGGRLPAQGVGKGKVRAVPFFAGMDVTSDVFDPENVVYVQIGAESRGSLIKPTGVFPLKYSGCPATFDIGPIMAITPGLDNSYWTMVTELRLTLEDQTMPQLKVEMAELTYGVRVGDNPSKYRLHCGLFFNDHGYLFAMLPFRVDHVTFGPGGTTVEEKNFVMVTGAHLREHSFRFPLELVFTNRTRSLELFRVEHYLDTLTISERHTAGILAFSHALTVRLEDLRKPLQSNHRRMNGNTLACFRGYGPSMVTIVSMVAAKILSCALGDRDIGMARDWNKAPMVGGIGLVANGKHAGRLIYIEQILTDLLVGRIVGSKRAVQNISRGYVVSGGSDWQGAQLWGHFATVNVGDVVELFVSGQQGGLVGIVETLPQAGDDVISEGSDTYRVQALVGGYRADWVNGVLPSFHQASTLPRCLYNCTRNQFRLCGHMPTDAKSDNWRFFSRCDYFGIGSSSRESGAVRTRTNNRHRQLAG